MNRLLALAALVACRVAVAQNPFDGYAFWLPSGELKIGDAKSEKEFGYVQGKDGFQITLRPRQTRMGVPTGQFVLIPHGKPAGMQTVAVGGTVVRLGAVTFLPVALTKGKESVDATISAVGLKGVLAYYTDDSDKLWTDAGALPGDYGKGIVAFWEGRYVQAGKAFLAGAAAAKTPEAARLYRRLARWAAAEMQLAKIKSGPGFYKLGLYSMTNGFWALAADCFKRATDLIPKNPDAWYMLADALSYRDSDLDQKMEAIYPYYRKAADLYPRAGANTYRTFFGFFRNLRVKDGDKEVVLHMTDDQMAYVKKTWEWCSAIMEGASHGMLRMVNTYQVFDKEFNDTAGWDPRPFEGLFKPGTVETFMKMTGWGASDTLGHDCGPDRSAFINMGLREWDVMLHEWNHSLDWAMIADELGVGVPETHSSDWCGFEPIPSMGMGHHSCNRYYMTPGMYRFVRGSDPATTPYVTAWAVSDPVILMPGTAKPDDEFANGIRKLTMMVEPRGVTFKEGRTNEGGYINLKAMFSDAPKNAYAFARTYVYSPVKQKVRMWLGADDNIRVWLNGRLVHKGIYWAVCNFQETKEKDQIATGIILEKGWNELIVQVTNAQHGEDWLVPGQRPDCWGFSVRFCDNQNGLVPGLKWSSREPPGFKRPAAFVFDPRSPKTYDWDKVRDDYTVLLPELTIGDLRAITGFTDLTANDDIFFSRSNGPFLAKSDPKDVGLNNELNWYFSPKEMAAVVRYKRDRHARDLLFLRPEAYETYTALLPVVPEAKKLGIKRQASQVIGYFTVPRPDSLNGRVVLVLDTYLGDKLPVDEEDLLDISGLM